MKNKILALSLLSSIFSLAAQQVEFSITCTSGESVHTQKHVWNVESRGLEMFEDESIIIKCEMIEKDGAVLTTMHVFDKTTGKELIDAQCTLNNGNVETVQIAGSDIPSYMVEIKQVN